MTLISLLVSQDEDEGRWTEDEVIKYNQAFNYKKAGRSNRVQRNINVTETLNQHQTTKTEHRGTEYTEVMK